MVLRVALRVVLEDSCICFGWFLTRHNSAHNPSLLTHRHDMVLPIRYHSLALPAPHPQSAPART